MPVDGRVVVVLPGPPRELRPMWPRAVESPPVQAVLARATPLLSYTVRMFGIPESEIAKSLREIEAGGVELEHGRDHHLPAPGEIEIDVRYRAEAAPVAEAVRAGLVDRHTRHLFSLDGETIDSQLAGLLGGRKLALAESCSGGLLAARITDLPGASAYFAGGVVAYSNEAKAELLGVDARADRGLTARSHLRWRRRCRAVRWSASAPTSPSRSPASPAPTAAARRSRSGYVCFDARLADGTAIARDPVIPGGREDIRERSALVAMHLLRTLLGGGDPPL